MYIARLQRQVIRAFLRNSGITLTHSSKKLLCANDVLYEHSITACFELARIYTKNVLLVRRTLFTHRQEVFMFMIRKYAIRYGYVIVEVDYFFSKNDPFYFINAQHCKNLRLYLDMLHDSIKVFCEEPFVNTSHQLYNRITKLRLYLSVFDNFDNHNSTIKLCTGITQNPRRYLKLKGLTPKKASVKIEFDPESYLLHNAYKIKKTIERDNFRDLSHKWRYYHIAYLQIKPLRLYLSLISNVERYRKLVVHYPKYRDICNYCRMGEKYYLNGCGINIFKLKEFNTILKLRSEQLREDWLMYRIDYIGNNLKTVLIRPLLYNTTKVKNLLVGVELSNLVFLTIYELNQIKEFILNWLHHFKSSVIKPVFINKHLRITKIKNGDIYFQDFKVSLHEFERIFKYL